MMLQSRLRTLWPSATFYKKKRKTISTLIITQNKTHRPELYLQNRNAGVHHIFGDHMLCYKHQIVYVQITTCGDVGLNEIHNYADDILGNDRLMICRTNPKRHLQRLFNLKL